MKPPSLALAITDAPRALVDAAVLQLSAPLLRRMPGAKGRHSVMVIPGFLGHDTGNGQLIRFPARPRLPHHWLETGAQPGPQQFQ